MEKSQTIGAIAKALITFHVKVDKIKKDAKNPFFKSKYASLSNILDSIQDALNESGLSFVQFPSGEHGLTTLLMHGESGEYLQSNYEMKPVKSDPQGIGSALTYQRRYALAAILGLNIDDDDDANKASGLNGTTSYNHKALGTAEKPLIPNEAFKKAVEAAKKGEVTMDKILAKYSLEAGQKSILETALLTTTN